MAKKPISPGKPKDPKSPQGPKGAAAEKKAFQSNLADRIDSYQELAETDGFLQRRNIRTALGVGDLTKWAEQYEQGYGGTADSYIKQPTNPQMPYEKFKDEAPRIKKVNTEKPRKIAAPGNDRSKNNNKGGGKK